MGSGGGVVVVVVVVVVFAECGPQDGCQPLSYAGFVPRKPVRNGEVHGVD